MDDRQDEKNIKAFAKKLKKLRQERGWSLRELAHQADLSHQFIDRIERGISNPSLTTIYRLADGLGIAPADLMV